VTEYSGFRKLCCILAIFRQKTGDCLGVVYVEKRIQYWDQAGVKNSKIPNTEIG